MEAGWASEPVWTRSKETLEVIERRTWTASYGLENIARRAYEGPTPCGQMVGAGLSHVRILKRVDRWQR